ncbi:MAG: hypothetical protein AABN95_13470, partial [Acidobacteriota bacterium]
GCTEKDDYLFSRQTRWGWVSLDSFTQGSRATRQPWAELHNRFAVQITHSGLDQSFLQHVGH